MQDIKKVTLYKSATIKETFEVIDKGAIRIAIIVDDEDKVIGTISDGDARRGLLKGYTLECSIEELYFKTPTLGYVTDSKDEIIKKAISKKLYQVPIVDQDNKLIYVEDLATLLQRRTRRNKVVLMAGGLGTRLRPLTNDIPKPLLQIGGKPILETIIQNFVKYGFVDIIISVNYKAEMIKDYFGDGEKLGANITYVEENKRLGTAGALSLLTEIPKEPFFVMNADLLTTVNFELMLDFHSIENSIATMAVREYEYQIPYGVVEVDESKIASIQEKPIQKFFVNAGIYILSPRVLENIPKDEFYDMPTLFDKLIQENKKALSFPVHEYWMDIGRMDEFQQAQSEYFRVFDA
ncbi:CBS domain-containing protein [Arcobacter sp. HD9-500m-PIT-SAG03]|nr:CBS domain-containing protein [Arcobacter sp. HD9-500m-PIT-SAG03]